MERLTGRWTNQPKPTDQPTDQWKDRPTDGPTNQNRPTNRPMDRPTDIITLVYCSIKLEHPPFCPVEKHSFSASSHSFLTNLSTVGVAQYAWIDCIELCTLSPTCVFLFVVTLQISTAAVCSNGGHLKAETLPLSLFFKGLHFSAPNKGTNNGESATDAVSLLWAHKEQLHRDLGPWRMLPWRERTKAAEW